METKRTVKSHFYWNLRELMEDRMINIEHLSFLTAISVTKLTRYWNNDERPSLRHVHQIAKVLDCEPDELLPTCLLNEMIKTELDEITKPEIEINYPTLDNFDIHKFIDECMSKKDRSVTIYFSNNGASVSVYPITGDDSD